MPVAPVAATAPTVAAVANAVAALREKLDKIRAPRCILPSLKVAGAVWVEPDLKMEIAYRGLTGSGELRAASFKGVMSD